jgi:hypothetical protein
MLLNSGHVKIDRTLKLVIIKQESMVGRYSRQINLSIHKIPSHYSEVYPSNILQRLGNMFPSARNSE